MRKEKQKKRRNSYFGYHFFVSLVVPLGYLIFGGKVINKKNMLKDDGFVFAGNHVGYFDAYLLCSATKRPLHFIAKKELFSNPITKWFFSIMHLIPVDRKRKNPEARSKAIEVLKDKKILCIFPEGTFHKEDILLPFKPGAVDFAIKTKTKIVPFAIVGNYKFRSNPKLIIGNPLDVSTMDVEKANELLKDIIYNMIIENQKKC